VTAPEHARWWCPVAPARRLATLRILVGIYAFGYLAGRFPAMVSVGRLPAAQFDPAGPVAILGQPLPAAVVTLIAALAVLLGAAFVLGWKFRITGPAFAIATVWVLSYRTSWGMIYHTENLLALHVWALGFSRAADTMSLDARGTATPDDSERYGWSIRLMCTLTVVTYVLAGVAKLRTEGLDWAFSDTLQVMVANDNLRKIELGDAYSVLGAALVPYDALFPPLATISLLTELGAPLALLGRRPAYVWVASAWAFHVGVLALMYILFHYQLFLFAYAPFLPVEKLADRLAASRRRGRGGWRGGRRWFRAGVRGRR
jgi:hypothetical protein